MDWKKLAFDALRAAVIAAVVVVAARFGIKIEPTPVNVMVAPGMTATVQTAPQDR